MDYLPCVEISPQEEVNASVIWLHGLGASGHDFAPIVPMIQLPEHVNIRYLFPHAPERAVTINRGYVMLAWYDILEMSVNRKIDTQGLLDSALQVQALIQREIDRGIDSQRIIVAGFSQGGAVAYESALTFSQPLGGLLVMSSYFATHASITPTSINKMLPIHIHHGTQDPVVFEQLGLEATQYLTAMGYHPHYVTYPAEHTVTTEQIADIAVILADLLK